VSGKGTSVKESMEVVNVSKPRSAGTRPWREPRKQRSSSSVKVVGLRKPWEKRVQERANRKALLETVRAIQEEKAKEKADERERLRLKRERKLENQRKSEKVQIVSVVL